MPKPPPATSLYAVKKIAEKTGIPQESVRKVIDEFVSSIVECLEAELPFSISGLGKFYYTYSSSTNLMSRIQAKGFFHDKVHRRLKFSISSTVKNRLQGWVHDLGLKNNVDKKEMLRLAIQPDEIQKTRRARVLEDQRNMGFNAELLFDEKDIPEADRVISQEIGAPPTVEEMLLRLGINMDAKHG